MKWTNEQLNAIELHGKNILCSAGAGSGKTAVLSQRVINNIINRKISVNEMLILTFTNASAFEMKERIRKNLEKNELNEELVLLDSSFITTFDSFCLSIVKRYGYLVDIPSDVSIFSDSVTILETPKILREIFTKHYIEKNERFLKLIDDFSIDNDNLIFNHIIELNKELDKYVNKKEILNNYSTLYLNDSFYEKLYNEYFEEIEKMLNNMTVLTYDLLNESNDKSKEVVQYYLDVLKLRDIKKTKDLFSETKLPQNRNQGDNYGNIVTLLKEKIKEFSNFALYENIQDLKDELLETKDNTLTIIDLINELDERLKDFKFKNKAFGFSDIMNIALDLVSNNNFVLEELKTTFKEILVDEYQDTSDVQEMLINKISNNNIYMVGDIKQSIYRFRNANPSLFEEKFNSYSTDYVNGENYLIEMNKNYRSRSEVISSVNDIFSKIMTNNEGQADYKNKHIMQFANTEYDKFSKNNYKLEFIEAEENEELSEYETEAFAVVFDIIDKVKNEYLIKDGTSLRRAKYSDFCILSASAKNFEMYKKVFESFSVPLKTSADVSIHTGHTLKLINNLLKLCFEIDKDDKKNLAYLYVSIARSYLFSYSDQRIYDEIKSYDYLKSEIFDIAKKINKVKNTLTVSEFFSKVVAEFKIIEKANVTNEIDDLLNKIDFLSTITKDMSKIYTLDKYIENFDELVKSEVKAELKLVEEAKDTVNIMTIHKSKGLEFPVCYIVEIGKKGKSTIKKFGYLDYLFIPKNIYSDDEKTYLQNRYYKKEAKENLSEKIRLFYVAMTRAKEKVILVGNHKKNFEKTSNSKNSFASILADSYLELDKTITESQNIDRVDYKNYKVKQYKTTNELKINVKEVRLEKVGQVNKRFSKSTSIILNEKTKDLIEYGVYLHSILEYTDFINPNLDLISDTKARDLINNFLKSDIMQNIRNSINILKEYEFISEETVGVIDLLVEYDTHFDLIDYKLKNINDEAYLKQLSYYKKYVEENSKKEVNAYLYSIIDKKIKKV